jgi:hypothetical protein
MFGILIKAGSEFESPRSLKENPFTLGMQIQSKGGSTGFIEVWNKPRLERFRREKGIRHRQRKRI